MIVQLFNCNRFIFYTSHTNLPAVHLLKLTFAFENSIHTLHFTSLTFVWLTFKSEFLFRIHNVSFRGFRLLYIFVFSAKSICICKQRCLNNLFIEIEIQRTKYKHTKEINQINIRDSLYECTFSRPNQPELLRIFN